MPFYSWDKTKEEFKKLKKPWQLSSLGPSSIAPTETSPLVSSSQPSRPTPSRTPKSSPKPQTPPQPTVTLLLWSRAYEVLRSDDAQLVDRYEKLLSKQLPGQNGTRTVASQHMSPQTAQQETDLDHTENWISAEPDTRRDQLHKILSQGLEQADNDRTKCTIFGHTFDPKDQVAQAATFIQAFKSLVSEAVKASPEASIAWAGVCVLLPLLTNPSSVEKENRDGLDYVTSRIRYYIELEHLLWPENLNNPDLKSEFESHIVDLYKKILKFQLMTVLRLYRKWTAQLGRDMIRYDDWKEMLKAVQEKEQIIQNESMTLNTLNSQRNLHAIRVAAEKHYDDMRSSLQSLLSVAEEQLEESRRTNQLIGDSRPIGIPSVEEACYKSADVQGSPRCEDGTRIRIQEKISHWASDEVGKPLFWLLGPAGTGKSTIARTIAKSLDEKKQLVAGYFFKRGEQGRNNTARLFPTIAIQLVREIPSFQSCLRRHIDCLDKTAIESQALKFQFEQLILKPLQDLPPSNDANLNKVIIIDALDECECNPEELSQILGLLCRFHDLRTVNLRVLLTSRLTSRIEHAFKPLQQKEIVCSLDLYRDFSEETQADIQTYLKTRFMDIRTNARVQKDPWPCPEELDLLVQLATNPEPLFIYAATLCRFVYDEQHPKNPRKQLSIWLEQCDGHKSQLDQLYEPILGQAFPHDEDADPQRLQFLGCLTLLAEPLSAESIVSLLDIDADDITWWLPQLYAVLDIPSERDRPIRLLHKSFSDFLLSMDNPSTHIYRVDFAETHAMLAARCVERMNIGLKRNICDIPAVGTSQADIEKQNIESHIPADLKYACLYWVHHLQRSKQAMHDSVYTFLKKHFLHWLEALSLLGELSSGVAAIRELSETIECLPDAPPGLANLINDAYRFILSQKGGIEVAPLQTYISALIFSPTNSLTRRLFEQEYPDWVALPPKVEANWNTCLQTLEGHKGSVYSVAFSGDGRQVASGSWDKTVKLWDADLGACLQTLEGHKESVNCVTFSGDSQRVASGSSDNTVKLWDAESGACLQTLEGHSGSIDSVAFSGNGQRVASASWDKTVKLWDTDLGACLQTLEGHKEWVNSVAFSGDGRQVASGSWDKTVKLWDAESGACLQTLEGHKEWVNSVAFSGDGRQVASGSWDKTVKLWDAESGHGSRLLTNVGAIVFKTPVADFTPMTKITLSSDYSFGGYSISIDGMWIVQDGNNLIWVPPEYRSVESRVLGSTIVIGCPSGRVWVMRLNTTVKDQ